MSNIVFPATIFYVFLLVFGSLAGITQAEDISFPEFPGLPDEDVGLLFGIISFILSFAAFIGLILATFFKLITFTFTGILPLWLSTIIFLPLVIVLTYEIIARMVRGS